MTEIWKDIPGFERIYQASTLGRIRSLERIFCGSGRWNGRKIEQTVLSAFQCANGYYAVNFTCKGRKQYLVHRLIAKTFLASNGKPHVNHIDCDKSNNAVYNLEWVTPKENIAHSCENNLNGQLILNTETGIFYHTVKEAGHTIGLTNTALRRRIIGRVKQKVPFIYA